MENQANQTGRKEKKFKNNQLGSQPQRGQINGQTSLEPVKVDQGSSCLTITANPIPRNILSSTPLPGKTFHSVHLVFSKFEQLLGFNVENGPISKSVIDLFQKDFSYWIKITCQSSRGRRWQSFFTVRSISSSVTFLFRHLYRIHCIPPYTPVYHWYTIPGIYILYPFKRIHTEQEFTFLQHLCRGNHT